MMKIKHLLLLSLLFVSFLELSAQCFMDRHSTDARDSWVSCTATMNPNPERGQSHWLMYDFGNSYMLTTTHLWNSNQFSETNQGINNYAIDYSMDGISWTTLGEFTLAEAPGSSFYEGEEGPDFGGVAAQFVLITALTNHGGSCYSFGEIRINLDSSVVPVELVDFSGQCDSNRNEIRLEWTTAAEISNAYYIVERSPDFNHWSEVSRVDSKGDSLSETYYDYSDKNPIKGKSYYRLTQVNLDGSKKELEVITVNCISSLQSVEFSPNPFSEKIFVRVSSDRDEVMEFKLYSSLGQEVFTQNVIAIRGENEIVLEPTGLNVGQYFITVKQGNTVVRKKLVYINQ